MSDKHVYFLRPVGQIGPIKIGCSKLPALRLETLTVWSPVRLELICSVPGSHKDEHTLHGMFRNHHVHGEWFGASKELLALIGYCEEHGELPTLPEVVKFPKVRHVGHRGRAAGKREAGELPPQKLEIARLMRGQYESGLTASAIAQEHGVAVMTVCRFIRAAGGTVHRGRPQATGTGVKNTDRADAMRAQYLGGATLQQIGNNFGVTRERVRQILRKTGVESLGRRPEHNRQAHKLTDAELNAVDLYKSDVAPSEIAARTGVPVFALNAALHRLNIPRKGAGHWLRKAKDEEVAALYIAGVPPKEIAARLGLSHETAVYRYLKRAGVKPRSEGKGSLERKASAIIAAYRAGATQTELAERFGASVPGISALLHRHDAVLPRSEIEARRVRAVIAANKRRWTTTTNQHRAASRAALAGGGESISSPNLSTALE